MFTFPGFFFATHSRSMILLICFLTFVALVDFDAVLEIDVLNVATSGLEDFLTFFLVFATVFLRDLFGCP